MSPKKFSTFWIKAVFTGTGKPPKEVKTADAVKAFIKENPKAVGYVAAAGLDDSVKQITIK